METQTLQRPEAKVDAGTTWEIDPRHSTIGFSVKHMMIATVRGRFDDFAGTIRFDPDQVDRSSIAPVGYQQHHRRRACRSVGRCLCGC